MESGGLEARCGPGDVEGWRHEALGLRRRAAVVQTRRYAVLKVRHRRRDVEVWRSGDALQA